MKGSFLIIVTTLVLAAATASAQTWQHDTFLKPEKHDAYGPGIHSDATGRPFKYETQQGRKLTIEKVKPDAYGPGVGMDQHGRPVRRVPAFETKGIE